MCQKYRPKIPCLKIFDLLSFLEDLNTALFDLDLQNQNNSDINITCNNFILMFNNILDQHAPLRFASGKETRSFHKPWLTNGLLTSVSKKNALYKKCYQQKPINFSQLQILQKQNNSPQRIPKTKLL